MQIVSIIDKGQKCPIHRKKLDYFCLQCQETPFNKNNKRVFSFKKSEAELHHFSTSKRKLEASSGYHRLCVFCLCLLKDGRVASCSEDRTIKIFNLQDCQCDLTLKGHKEAILYVSQLDNGCLVSSSLDGEIKVWGTKKGGFSCVKTIKGHSDWVFKVSQLSGNSIGSCSADKTIKIWDDGSYQCLKTLEAQDEVIKSFIEVKKRKLIVSCGDMNIYFWSSETYKCEKVICNYSQCCWSNSLIDINEDKIVVGGKGVSVIELETFELVRCIKGKKLEDIRSVIILDDGSILCGCKTGISDGSFINIDAITYKILSFDIGAHKTRVTDLIGIKGNKLISCSEDGIIKIWNY